MKGGPLFASFAFIFIGFSLAKEVPLGLRPAKAVDEPEKPIVPKLEQQEDQQELGLEESPSIGPTQKPTGNEGEEQKNGAEKPLVFQKNGKSKRRLSPLVPGTAGTQVVQQVIKPNAEQSEAILGIGTSAKPTVRTIPPPAGKDYGVNTLLQTNLVDSKGRVLKGVSAVPIPVPDIRNAKASRASASRVETEAEKAVQINFSG